jgi:SEFIR domain
MSKVFISYSHDSREHVDRVLTLSNRLRGEGVDCRIDQYEVSPPEGWPTWCTNQVEEAEFVLVVCTATYERRFRGKEQPGKGLGVTWEGFVITQELYDAQGKNSKFIPVIFAGGDSEHVPIILRGVTRYDLSNGDDYDSLYRRLTHQPVVEMPELGEVREKLPRVVQEALPELLRKHTFKEGEPSGPGAGLSGEAYAGIALIGVTIAIGFTIFYIHKVPELVKGKVQSQLFYVLLIPWALSSAVFLFGALRSYARFTQRHVGTVLELGGPVVLFLLILWGGFALVPQAPDTFDLTVRAHSADGNEQIIKRGTVTLDLNNDRRTESFRDNGEADFKGIPSKFISESAQINILSHRTPI